MIAFISWLHRAFSGETGPEENKTFKLYRPNGDPELEFIDRVTKIPDKLTRGGGGIRVEGPKVIRGGVPKAARRRD